MIDVADMDFEEISDCELEEEARNKGLADALGVDWASLVQESRKIKKDTTQETTAKQRWQPHRILLDIGISYKYAGAEYAANLIANAKAKVEQERLEKEQQDKLKNSEDKIVIKQEIEDVADSEGETNSDDKSNGKLEEKSESQPKIDDVYNDHPIHPIAFVQVALKKEKIERANLFSNAAGPNCRALSARRDLMLRRRLCGLPSKELGPNCWEQLKPDPALAAQAIKLFQKATGQVL